MSSLNRKQLFAATVVLLLVPALTWGAGFAIFEHGNRAMAMGGAFTAVANDPSAIFWNPAGLAFQDNHGKKFELMAGATFITVSQDFYGEDPYPGSGYFTSQKDQVFYPPHTYFVWHINDKMTLGTGLFTPFGLGTWWPENFAGRFIGKRIDLRTFDLNPNLAIKLSDKVAVSVGVDYYVGQIDLTSGIGAINPFTQKLTDIGQVHMYTDGMGNDDWGWNAGLFVRLPLNWTFGLSYRSEVDLNYDGYGSFSQFATGYPEYDAAVAQLLPFGHRIPMKTEIDFPDMWSVGFAWNGEKWTVSIQYNEQGWSSFNSLDINFPTRPDLSESVKEGYDDVSQYRFGIEYRPNARWAFQAGALYDETPQPAASMSPLLGDGDRTGISLGLSWVHPNWRLDIGDLYLFVDQRATNGQSYDGYDGRYKTTSANLIGASITMSF